MTDQQRDLGLFDTGQPDPPKPPPPEPPKEPVKPPQERTPEPPEYSPPPPPSYYPPPKDPKKPSKNKRGLNILFTVLIIIMAGTVTYLLITLSTERQDAEEMRVTLEMQKDNLTNELNELYASYDSLNTKNDSMNLLVDRKKQEITDLLQIKASNAKKIQIYEEQVSSLRNVLKDYIFQVDSLNQANLRLQAENREANRRFQQATNINRELEDQNRDMKDQIEVASVLKAISIVAEPIDDKGTVQKKIKKVEKVRVCFTMSENRLAKAGRRMIYLRISRPDERVMVGSNTNMIKVGGKSIAYSASREVEYEGANLDVCIFYDAGPNEIIAGTYYVDLIMNGEEIGTTSFSLK